MNQRLCSFIKYGIITFVISLAYIILFIVLNNANLVYSTIISDFPVYVKTGIIFSLLTGIGTAMSILTLLTLVLIALLTSINMILLLINMKRMRSMGSMKVVVGGSSLLGLVSSGCASCGLPLLAFLGLGSSVSVLPLGGYEFSLVVIATLLVSTYISFKQMKKSPQCFIN